MTDPYDKLLNEGEGMSFDRTPLELAVSLMGRLHFHTERPQPWWCFAIYHAQRSQVGCAVYHGSPGMSIFDTREVFGMSINDTIEDAVFGAIADAMQGGMLAAHFKHELERV